MHKPKSTSPPNLTCTNPGAADRHRIHDAHGSVNPENADTPIRVFVTFTHDLHDLADWFKSCGVTSVPGPAAQGQASAARSEFSGS